MARKHIKQIQVQYDDGSVEAFVGGGYMNKVDTSIKGDPKEKILPRDVSYVDVHLEVRNEQA